MQLKRARKRIVTGPVVTIKEQGERCRVILHNPDSKITVEASELAGALVLVGAGERVRARIETAKKLSGTAQAREAWDQVSESEEKLQTLLEQEIPPVTVHIAMEDETEQERLYDRQI